MTRSAKRMGTTCAWVIKIDALLQQELDNVDPIRLSRSLLLNVSRREKKQKKLCRSKQKKRQEGKKKEEEKQCNAYINSIPKGSPTMIVRMIDVGAFLQQKFGDLKMTILIQNNSEVRFVFERIR